MSSSNFIIDSDIDGDDQSGDRDDQSRDRDVQSADRDDYSGDDCDDYSRCVAYVDFKDLIDDIRSKYTHLNPKDGKLFQHVRRSQDRSDLTLDETGQEFIRGGIVAIMAAWESYVHDLFQEAFYILLEVGSSKYRSLDDLHKFWPTCRTIIQDEIKRRACAEKKGDHVEVVAYDLLCAAEKSSEVTGGEKVWFQLLRTHCESVLDKKTLLPIFSPQDSEEWAMTIDELFRQLFKISKKSKRLSEILIEVGGFEYNILTPADGSARPVRADVHLTYLASDCSQAIANEPSISDRTQAVATETLNRSQAIEALCNITRLYYGLRCTLVHGKHKKTLQGALKNFPKDSASFCMPSMNKTKIREYYVKLYRKVEKDGRRASMSYLEFLNLTRFYRSAAYFLMLALARWIHSNFTMSTGDEVLIWEYDPELPPKPIRTQSQS